MTRQHHLDVERYLEAIQGQRDTSSLVLLVHRHAVELCPECAAEWELVGADQRSALEMVSGLGPPSPSRADETSASSDLHEADLPVPGTPPAAPIEAVIERKRQVWRRARRDLRTLQRMPAGERAGRVRRARRRFQSRAVAELLLQESRAEVRTDPQEAESLACLVPLVLTRFRGKPEPPWVPHLVCRAAGHRANALRVSGDLEAAAREFSRLRAEMLEAGVLDAALLAEIASLEASLARDQYRFDDAKAGLDVAQLLAEQVGDRLLLARVLMQRAYLQRLLGDSLATLKGFERAAAVLGEEQDRYLHLSVVVGQILVLCDLRRFTDAEEMLNRHQELFEEDGDAHTGATLSGLRGRIALGLEQFDPAIAAFQMARESLLDLGRHYDAALACLYLAQVYRSARDARALRKLAGGLVALFRSHGVEGEILAVMEVLARWVEAGRLTPETLRDLETRLRRSSGAGSRGAF